MARTGARISGWRYRSLIAGYLVGYVGLDWASYIYPVAPPLAITPWNPPPGLSIALLLRFGPRNGPWLFAAALLADLLVRGPHAHWPLLLVAAALPAIVYTACAVALRGALRFDPDFASLHDAILLVAVTTVATAALALAFVGLFCAGGELPVAEFWQAAAHFWIGDLIGILVTAPLLLVLTRRPWPRSRASAAELAAQVAAILAALWIVFESGWADELKLFYVLFLPLIWIAMRHGIEGAVVATAIIQVGLIAAMRAGGYATGDVLEFQVLLVAVALTGLFLGMTVSERRAIARQLRDRELELDRSLRLAGASEMASALAHELNQPLAAIGSYARACQVMLADGDRAPAKLRETMEKVTREVARAGDVVHRLRDFFRTGSGRPDRVQVTQLLQAAVATAAQRAERHGVHCRIDCPPSLPAVHADRIHAEIVLHNLVSNAIDALATMTAGERNVTISASLDGAQFVRISVADNGPGVAPDMRGQLFEPFATSKPHGMGLGLAISRSLVEAGGGRLWQEAAGRGSRFSFTLPIARSAA
ncbi:MAG: MASE1 domain-containing protein [Casimicrobiaceae bacterium]